MRNFTKGFMLAVAAILLAGMMGSTLVAGAKKYGKSSREPKNFDLYVVQGSEIVRLQPSDLSFTTVLSLGPNQAGMYGLPGPPKTSLDSRPLEIMVFDPATAGAAIRLAKLAHIDTAPAHTFDLRPVKAAPAIFQKIYGVPYDEARPVNLWCVEGNIPLRVNPVAKKPGWYRAIPEQELAPGMYAINFGGIDGPRVYTGDASFYPFVLASGPPPASQCPPAKTVK